MLLIFCMYSNKNQFLKILRCCFKIEHPSLERNIADDQEYDFLDEKKKLYTITNFIKAINTNFCYLYHLIIVYSREKANAFIHMYFRKNIQQ